MERWKISAVAEIHRHARDYRFVLTAKALREYRRLRETLPVSLDLPELEEEIVRDLLLELSADVLRQRVRSTVTDEFLYVFRPEFFGLPIYLKVVLRKHCVVISLHEDH